MNLLGVECRRVGLEINIRKTEVMRVSLVKEQSGQVR